MMLRKKREAQRTRQASFDFDAGKHGGKREHSGRPRGPKPKLWHRSRKDFPATYPCHVTLRVRRDIPLLRRGKIVREVEQAFRRACSGKEFRLVHYSIQDDHAHLIVEADGVAALGRGMKRLAGLFAFAVNRAIGRGRTGKVLADRYHHEVLTCPRQVRNAIAYVLLNARRHAAKRIARLRKQGKPVKPLAPARMLDSASSGRWFDGWREGAVVDRSPPPLHGSAATPAVAAPRTWFLRVGWRKHQLIDPSEIPAKARA
ncbi:MAG TPA: transposase [Myxococcota bacterium]|nr:transposase [Myxococcota bacterium]